MIRDALYLVTTPIRLWWMLVCVCADSLAVVLGMKWRDPYGRTHWREGLR